MKFGSTFYSADCQNFKEKKSILKKIHDFDHADLNPKYIFFLFEIFFSLKFSMPKNNVAGNSEMPLSVNLLKLESSILPRAKRATNRNNEVTEKRS